MKLKFLTKSILKPKEKKMNFFTPLFYALMMLVSCFFINFQRCFAATSFQKHSTVTNGKIVVGTNATFRPFEYIENGQIVGYDIDLTKELIKKAAEDSNIKIEIVDMNFDALIPELGKKIDVVAAAMTKNEEREKVVNFTEDYYTAKQFILTTKNRNIEKEDDLKGLILASQTGTTAQSLVDDLEKKFEQKKSKTYSDYLTMVNDLKASRIDAIVLDKNTALTYEKLYPNELKTIDGEKFGFEEEHYCLACPKNKPELLNALNEQIRKLKADGKFLTELTQKYISPSEQTATQNSTNIKFETLEKGKFVVGTNSTLFPFEYVENGQIVGFDIELIKELVKKATGDPDIKIEIVDMNFDTLIAAINSKKIDVAIAAMSKNEEREKAVNFTETYYTTKPFVLTIKDKNIEKEDDLKGLILASQTGTTEQSLVDELEKKFGQKKSKTYSDYLTMVNDLKASRIDAIVLDKNTALTYEKMYPDKLKAIDGEKFNFAEESYSIACPKNNSQLCEALNEQIRNLKSDGKFLEELTQKYINQEVKKVDEPGVTPKEKNENSLKNQIKIAIFDNERWKLYLNGLGVTLQVTLFAAILGLCIGIAIALIRIVDFKGAFKFVKILSQAYVDIMRGTPLLIQLLILWCVILQNSKNAVAVAVLACGLNSGAYVSEIIRGAMNAIDKGQTEAGLAMGFSSLQTLFFIILPQGLRNAIPTLCNEIISLLKETAIVGYISVVDLTRAADLVRASTYQAFVPLVFVAAIYFIITKTASLLLGLLEKKLRYK